MIRRSLLAAALFLGLGLGVPSGARADTEPSLLLHVVDQAGRPVAGATVRAAWRSPEEDEEHTLRETTSPRGTVRLTGLPADEEFWIAIEKAGFTPGLRMAVADGSRELQVTLQPGSVAVGRVVDEEGRPVAGAEVELSGVRAPAVLSTRRARSGPTGRFRFRDLPPEELALTIRRDGFATFTADQTVEGGTSGRLGPFVLRRGTTLRGTVTDAAGRPVAGASVWTLTSRELSQDAQASAVTAADGTFVVPHRPPGEELSLWVCADGFLEGIDTVAFSDEPIAVTLERAATVRGRVVDTGGAPRPGATIAAEPPGGWGCGLRTWSPCPTEDAVTADAEGRFAFVRLAPGWYALQASAPGFLDGGSALLRFDAGDAGEEQEIRLDRGTAVVTGRVLDPDGAPIPGAHLQVWGERSHQETDTGPDGSFRAEGIDAETVRINAHAERFEEGSVEVEVGSAGATADIVLEPESVDEQVEIHGRVVGPDGSPVEGALVTAANRSVSSDRDGSFVVRVRRGLPGTPWEVEARKQGFAQGRTTYLIAGPRVDGIEIRLETGAEIHGRVLGLVEAQLPGVMVFVTEPGEADRGQSISAPVRVDAQGRFRIGPVPAGTWEVQAQSGYRSAKAPVVLEPGQAEATAEPAFAPTQEVTGRVLDPDGMPAAHAWLYAFAPGQDSEQAWTHVDGTFTLRAPMGDLTLSVGTQDLRQAQPLHVGDGPVSGVEIRLEHGAVLSGHIDGLSPGDLPFVSLRGPTSEAAIVEPDGSYSTRRLSSGTWKLEVDRYLESGVQVIRRTLAISPEATEITLDLDFTGVPITAAEGTNDEPR